MRTYCTIRDNKSYLSYCVQYATQADALSFFSAQIWTYCTIGSSAKIFSLSSNQNIISTIHRRNHNVTAWRRQGYSVTSWSFIENDAACVRLHMWWTKISDILIGSWKDAITSLQLMKGLIHNTVMNTWICMDIYGLSYVDHGV